LPPQFLIKNIMKRLSLFAIILIAFCTVALAQPRAIGGRIGWGIGPSYQHQIGAKNMLQADVDLIGYGWWGVQGTVTFNWLIPLVSVSAGELTLYPGVGVGGGYEWWSGGYWGGYRGYYGRGYGWGGTGFVGVAGMIGVEWSFKFPLQLSFEYRPVIGPSFYRGGGGVGFYWHGLYASAIAIGVRYKFGGK
jgi:hypothetical protein